MLPSMQNVFPVFEFSDDSSSPVWCQAIILTDYGFLPFRPSETYFNEIWFKIQQFSMKIVFENVICKLVAILSMQIIHSLRPRQNRRHFADDIFKCPFFNKNVWISIKISLKFVPKGPINNIPSLVQIMAWRRPGDKPISEPMMVRLPTHICVNLPQWVNIKPCKLGELSPMPHFMRQI